jgi:hypothetical protein
MGLPELLIVLVFAPFALLAYRIFAGFCGSSRLEQAAVRGRLLPWDGGLSPFSDAAAVACSARMAASIDSTIACWRSSTRLCACRASIVQTGGLVPGLIDGVHASRLPAG